MLHHFLLVFLSVFIFIHANPYNCDGEHEINPPNDINNPFYYPNGWKEADIPPVYAANQTCNWKITVPKGLYAFLTITGNTTSTKLTVTDSVGNTDWVADITNQEEYFLLDPQFSVYLESKAEGTFGMKIKWNKVGTFNPSSEPVYQNIVPTVKYSGDFDNGLVIYSTSNISLTSIRPPITGRQVNWNMRNTVVFDGKSINDRLIGNLFQIYDQGNHIISSGNYLTLYSFIPYIKADNYVLIQNYENVRQFSTYHGVSCFNKDLCPVIIDARNGSSAAIRMSVNPHFLEQFDVSPNSTLTVYTGIVDLSDQLIQYSNIKNLTSSQKFNSLFTTYVVDEGVGILYQSNDNLDTNWDKLFDGKNGILASKNLGDSSSDQNVQEIFSGPITDIYKMTLNIKRNGLIGDSTLTVTMSSAGKVNFNEK